MLQAFSKALGWEFVGSSDVRMPHVLVVEGDFEMFGQGQNMLLWREAPHAKTESFW